MIRVYVKALMEMMIQINNMKVVGEPGIMIGKLRNAPLLSLPTMAGRQDVQTG